MTRPSPALTSAAPRPMRTADVFLTAIAPSIWGSTYITTTELLPQGYPMTVAVLRALPAGLLLLAIVRTLPFGIWWIRSLILGALNFSIFWSFLFLSAYRLPGGVAATVGAIQPLIVIGLANLLLGRKVRSATLVAAIAGLCGIALLVLTPAARLDPVGIAAGLAGAVSMAFGTVLSRRWQPPVSALTFTAWQLTAGGLLLLPVALVLEPPLPALTLPNIAGFVWLGLIGGAFAQLLWFRGIARLEPAIVASLGFLSPVMAVTLGWVLIGQSLTPFQILAILIVMGSIWYVQHSERKAG